MLQAFCHALEPLNPWPLEPSKKEGLNIDEWKGRRIGLCDLGALRRG